MSDYNKEIAEGFELLTQGEFEKSLEKFITAIEIDSTRPDAFSLASEAFAQIGDIENAKSHAELAYKIDSEKPEYVLQYASMLYATGNSEESMRLANEAQKKGEMPEIHLLKSNIYMDMEEDQKALKEAKMAFEMDKNPIYRTNYAIVLKESGKIKESTEILKKMVQENPDDLDAIYLLFQNELAEDHLSEAMNYITKCISLNDSEPLFYSELASMMEDFEDNELAEKYYKKAFDVSDNDPEMAMQLAEFYNSLDKVQEGIDVLEVSHSDEDPEYHLMMGKLLMGKKEYNKAISHLDIAIEMADDPEAKIVKGSCLMEINRLNEAQSILKEALKQDFQTEYVESLLNQVWWKENSKKFKL